MAASTSGVLQPVVAGQAFIPKAADWNEFVKTAREHKGIGQKLAGSPITMTDPQAAVKVRNDSGVTLARFAACEAYETLIVPDDEHPDSVAQVAFKVRLPQYPESMGRVAVLLGPLEDGRIGWARLTGLTHALLDIETNGDFDRCDLVVGSVLELITHPAGSGHVVWHADEADESGLYKALVNLTYGGWWPRLLRGIAQEAISAGDSGDVLYGDDGASVILETWNQWDHSDMPSGAVCWSEWNTRINATANDPGHAGPSVVVWECP